ncbi:unnamed protein product, partial [Acanthoscelides obtectus]
HREGATGATEETLKDNGKEDEEEAGDIAPCALCSAADALFNRIKVRRQRSTLRAMGGGALKQLNTFSVLNYYLCPRPPPRERTLFFFNKVMDSWSEEKILRLINVYKIKTLLWDPKNENHFKKNLKEDAWREIADEMETTAEQCKKKIISLLASFRQEKNKTKQGTSTGKGRDEVYCSRWFAYEAFRCLDTVVRRAMAGPISLLDYDKSLTHRLRPQARYCQILAHHCPKPVFLNVDDNAPHVSAGDLWKRG